MFFDFPCQNFQCKLELVLDTNAFHGTVHTEEKVFAENT